MRDLSKEGEDGMFKEKNHFPLFSNSVEYFKKNNLTILLKK